MTRLFALVPAAGAGRRMGSDLPKQYLTLHGRTLAEHTLNRLLALPSVELVLVAVAEADPWWPSLAVSRHERVETVTGGASRAESVLAGLDALRGRADDDDRVLVHDMARPCVRPSDVETLLRADGEDGALLALACTDTLKETDDDGSVAATLDRGRVWRALTPQLFPLGLLRRALRGALAAGATVTDEASAVERLGARPRLVPGHPDNLKVTRPGDLALAEFLLTQQAKEGRPWRCE